MSTKNVTEGQSLGFWSQEKAKTAALVTVSVIAVAACIFLAIAAHNNHNAIMNNWDKIHKIPIDEKWLGLYFQIKDWNLAMVFEIGGSVVAGVTAVSVVSYLFYKQYQSKQAAKAQPYEENDLSMQRFKAVAAFICAAATLAACITFIVLAANKHEQIGRIWEKVHYAWGQGERPGPEVFANITHLTNVGWGQLGIAIASGMGSAAFLALGMQSVMQAKKIEESRQAEKQRDRELDSLR